MQEFKQLRDKRLREKITKHLESEELTKHQRELIEGYNTYSQKQGLDLYTIESRLREFKVFFRDFKVNPKEAKQKDVDKYLNLIGSRDYKDATIKTKKVFLIMFFEWLYGKKKDDIPTIKDIKIKDNGQFKLPEELISPEEVKRMVQIADNFRDKCLIILLYESAARRGEILQLKIKHCDITPEKYAMVTVPMGKTVSRKLPILFAMPHLKNWLNAHPLKDDPNAPLFITQGSHLDNPLGEDGLKMIIKKVSKRSKIKKNIHPHLFRHSRLTELAKELTEQELKVFAGWVGDSKMVKTYVHLSGSDVSNKLLANAGLIDSKTIRIKQKVLEQIVCPRCRKINSADVKYCDCGLCLDLKTAAKEIEQSKEDKDKIKVLENQIKDMPAKFLAQIINNPQTLREALKLKTQ
tara:strand:+ start:127 stop:1350 length:1224 start_codon:yes stop_codon:yes gene_type:complete